VSDDAVIYDTDRLVIHALAVTILLTLKLLIDIVLAFKVLKYPVVPITFGVLTFPAVHVFVVIFVKDALVAER
jgi:hypothetical protein